MLSEEELADVPLLVFCNKQDVEGALKPEGISEQLGLAGGEKGRDWSVRGSCAVKGEGIEEGLDWCVMNNMHVPFTKKGLSGLSMLYKRNRTTLVVPFSCSYHI
jgi:signal recognition particle receptor subunit beta